MIQFNNYIQIITVLYLFISVSLYLLKPKIMFQSNKMKQFGVGKSKTIFYYPLVIVLVAIVLYIIVYQFYISLN